jgi:hypothetical protein
MEDGRGKEGIWDTVGKEGMVWDREGDEGMRVIQRKGKGREGKGRGKGGREGKGGRKEEDDLAPPKKIPGSAIEQVYDQTTNNVSSCRCFSAMYLKNSRHSLARRLFKLSILCVTQNNS